MLFITFNKTKIKIVFFNESFDLWNKTKNIKKLPIIQWIIFSFLFKTIITWIDCFIEIISKKIKCNFIQFKFVCFLLLLNNDIQIWLIVDEWMKKLNEKRMMKKTIRLFNRNRIIAPNDINNKYINQMNERKWMIKMIWRLKNSNKLIRFFISLFHFYHLLKNAESRIDKSKGKVCFIYKKFGQNWSKITIIFLCFYKKFLKSLNLVNANHWNSLKLEFWDLSSYNQK